MSWDLVKVLVASVLAVTDAIVGYEQRSVWHVVFALLWAFIAGLYMAKVVIGL